MMRHWSQSVFNDRKWLPEAWQGDVPGLRKRVRKGQEKSSKTKEKEKDKEKKAEESKRKRKLQDEEAGVEQRSLPDLQRRRISGKGGRVRGALIAQRRASLKEKAKTEASAPSVEEKTEASAPSG